MAFFDWLANRHVNYPESYALDRDSLWENTQVAIERLFKHDGRVAMIAHFPEMFEMIEQQLNVWQIDFSIPESSVPLEWFVREPDGPRLMLCLAAQLRESRTDDLLPRSQATETLSLMVMERHPWSPNDERIKTIASQSRVRNELGYLLSLDDPVLENLINETAITLLRQMGMDDHGLVTSMMVTRRINRALNRRKSKLKDVAEEFLPADSSTEWMELNLGQ